MPGRRRHGQLRDGDRLRAPVAIAAVALTACSLFRSPEEAPRFAYPRAPAADPDTHSIGITWIGHATVLIRLDDRWVLTDPVLGDRIGKVYARKVRAGIDPRDLPDLTAVVISHAHFDHLDVPSLRAIQPVAMLAPPGAVRFLPGGEQVALDTWERWERDGVAITAVPASHGDGRYLVDRWVHDSHTGYVIEYGSLCVYFAGDTGWAPEQSEAIASKFDIDVALIPVGPAGRPKWVERWRMDVHVNPQMAMRLFAAVGAQWMVPIHYGTFYNDLARERPIVMRAIEDSGVGTRVRVIGIGDTAEFVY